MHRGAAVVATLVLVAGCSAVPFGADDAGSGPTDTVTPAPVADSPTPERATVSVGPPGVGANGTVDADALSEAHVATIGNSTYTWSIEQVRTGSNTGQFTRQVVVGNETFVVTQSRDWTGANVSMYVNETGGFLQSVTGDRARYDFYRLPGGPEDYVLATALIQRFLDGRTVDVSTLERRGRTYFRLYVAGGPAPSSLGPADARVSGFTVTAYVTPEGFVRSLTAEYDLSRDSGRSHVSVRYDYSRVGESTATPPEWVDHVSGPSTPTPAEPDGTPNRTATPVGTTPGTPVPADTPTPTDSLDGSTPTAAVESDDRATATDGSR
jgi:hypothetical protein